MRITKYIKEYIIQGHYGFGWEDETAASTLQEAKGFLKDYRLNSQYPSRLVTRRVPNPAYKEKTT